MSHIVRCDVLDARHDHRLEWLDETLDFIAGKYPRLDDLKLAQLELIGRQYLKPPIPHGKQHNAITRDRRFQEHLEAQEPLEELEPEQLQEPEAQAA